MKLTLLLCFSTLLAMCISEDVQPPAASYGDRGFDLGMQVFQQVVQTRPLDNVVLSPHGVASILGMLLPGAHGETRKQILNSLQNRRIGWYKMVKKLHKTLTSKDAVMIANAMFIQTGFPLLTKFVATNKANFHCENRSLDFSKPRIAADAINNWVSNKTKGHISSLVSEDMLNSPLVKLVAVNSIFFKGLWKSRFQPEKTKQRPFHGSNGESYNVPMMSQLSVFNIGMASTPQGLNYRVIELPYHGNNISMLVVVPSKADTALSQVIPHINSAAMQNWTKLMHMTKVRLLIPKFTAEAEVDLKAPLTNLGISNMFSQRKADFRHMCAEPLFVSNALQKAKITVDEDGTTAAAATAAVLMARSSPPWVTVDRPFLFLIKHKQTGTVLFMGQINKP